jgi:hypothetical protein
MPQDNLSRRPKRWYDETYLVIIVRYFWSHRGIKISIGIALMLLLVDAAIFGSVLFSLAVCPLWFLFSILKNVIQRPGWRLAFLRIAFPVLTLGLVYGNFVVQIRVADANATRIIAACEKFQTDTSKFPETLEELVPRYVPSIPYAQYCVLGDFFYNNGADGNPFLGWCIGPSIFDHKSYSFKDRKWFFTD